MLLTWIMLIAKVPVIAQIVGLIMTFIAIYLHLIVIQDYFYLKTHENNRKLRKDVRIIEPLIPERFKKDDKQT